MSRVHLTAVGRPGAVWLVVSAALVASSRAVPGAWRAAHGRAEVADVLVAVCATVLAASLVWLWVITTTTVAGLLTGRRGRWPSGATRRLVLLACGAAVVAGPALPAAAGGEGPELLVGLSLPDRATAPVRPALHQQPPAPQAPADYVVRPGDSLWSIARTHPDDATDVEERWRAIWRANRDVVGDDPDLILPGQALRLPTTRRTDGDPR